MLNLPYLFSPHRSDHHSSERYHWPVRERMVLQHPRHASHAINYSNDDHFLIVTELSIATDQMEMNGIQCIKK